MARTVTGGDSVVEAVGLTKVFSDFWMRAKARAVDDIDFEIRPNEIFGLLGPNGSGKSTTIKMILGLLRKSRGKLSVFGKDPSDVSIKKRIGYLPEESYMYRFLDARETLDYYAKLFGLDRGTRKRRIDELIDMVGLTHAAHRKVGEYSKGMTRRLGIAQALVNDPELLILDEPTSGLDPIGTRQVKDLLTELGRRGTTILLSSHLLADVEDVCDRMVILYGGKIRAQGTAGELLRDRAHTVLRMPHADDATIAEIDAVLQRREGVSIESVEAPRQRLEDFFMQIVEQARSEQAANAGASHGGETASFLRANEGDGEELIDALVEEREEAPRRSVERPRDAAAAAAAAAPATDDAVLGELLDADADEAEPERPRAAPKAPMPEAPSDVDASLIDDLLGDDDEARDR